MDGLARACDELGILQRQFEAGASRWFRLRHVLVSWPENANAPTDDELPEDFRGCTVTGRRVVEPDTGEVWIHFSPGPLMGFVPFDNQEFRYREGFASYSEVLALPKKHRGDEADIEDEYTCRDRFALLANRAVDILDNGIGEALGIGTRVMACPWRACCQKWFLILHEVLGITPKNLVGRRVRNDALRFEIVEDLFLDSARAIAKVLAAPGESDSVERRVVDLASKGVAPRNDRFKTWYEDKASDTYHSPTTIVTRWNAMSLDARKQVCPAGFGKVKLGTVKGVVCRRKKVRKG